jgi:cellulase
MMVNALSITAVLSTIASTALGHGTVSGIVANGVYTGGWKVSYWYDLVNKVPIPQTPGWYMEQLDNGFVPPNDYQYEIPHV